MFVVVSCVGATDARVSTSARRPDDASTTTTTSPVPACVASLSVERKAGQLVMVLVPSPAAARDLVALGLVAGYGLVGAQSGDIAGEAAGVAAGAPLGVLASGDDEGGTVQRFRDLLGPLPSAASLASDHTPGEAGQIFGEYAGKLHAYGLNMNFGPSLDVGSGSGLGTRSFGDSVDTVSEYGLAVISGVRSAGLMPVAKHWPGIGAGAADPHNAESPIADIATLRARDMVPFDRAIEAGVAAIMVSHAVIPDLTDGLPASLSRAAVTGELRERQGFDGLVITDSLGMGAVAAHFDNAAAAAVSISAGADLALVSLATAVPAAHQGIVDAINAGRIPMDQVDRSVARVLAAKGITGECPPAPAA